MGLKELFDPTEPEMPDDVASFLETGFGKRVKSYFMSEFDFIMNEGYREAKEMLDEERQKVQDLQKQLDAIAKNVTN